jgi:DNA repair exonuclease SbcCD nuclease subunit
MARSVQNPKLRAVAHGDPHLERFSSQYFKNLLGNPDDAFISSIERLCEHATAKKIGHVFLLGDIADHPNPKQETIIKLLHVMNKYIKLKFWLITGNHDVSARGRSGMIVCEFLSEAGLLPNVTVFTKPKMKIIDGIPVYFMPYGFDEQPKGPYLGVGHHSVVGASYDSGLPVGEEGINISNKRAFWIMGHLHEYQEHPWGIYAGTGYQINFGETDDKAFIELDAVLENGRVKVSHSRIPCALPYTLKNLSVRKEADWNKVKQFDERKIFYRLLYDPSVEVPSKFQADNPHVIECSPMTKAGTEVKITSATDAPEDVFHLSPTRGLTKYLIKRGLEKGRAKAGTRFVKRLIS